jgi:hypothetical protein
MASRTFSQQRDQDHAVDPQTASAEPEDKRGTASINFQNGWYADCLRDFSIMVTVLVIGFFGIVIASL